MDVESTTSALEIMTAWADADDTSDDDASISERAWRLAMQSDQATNNLLVGFINLSILLLLDLEEKAGVLPMTTLHEHAFRLAGRSCR